MASESSPGMGCSSKASPPEAAELLDQLGVCPPVGRAHPHVDAAGEPVPLEVVRAPRARVDLDRQHLRTTPGQDLDFRHEPRNDQVADQVRQALLQIERLSYTADVPLSVLHTQGQYPAGRVGKGNDRLQRALRRGELALKLEGLALGALEDLDEVHGLRSLLGSLAVLHQ